MKEGMEGNGSEKMSGIEDNEGREEKKKLKKGNRIEKERRWGEKKKESKFGIRCNVKKNLKKERKGKGEKGM